jgi:hypothetical protein
MNEMKMPGFTAEATLYRTSQQYHLATRWDGNRGLFMSPAQFMPGLPNDGGNGFPVGQEKGCTFSRVPTDECGTGCKCSKLVNGELVEFCVSAFNCPPPPVQCGPCLLPTDRIRQKILTGLPIDPATDLIFEHTCQQGTNPPFTQGCEICSQETRIGLPIVSDKCIKVCMRGFDPASIRVDVRDC